MENKQQNFDISDEYQRGKLGCKSSIAVLKMCNQKMRKKYISINIAGK